MRVKIAGGNIVPVTKQRQKSNGAPLLSDGFASELEAGIQRFVYPKLLAGQDLEGARRFQRDDGGPAVDRCPANVKRAGYRRLISIEKREDVGFSHAADCTP